MGGISRFLLRDKMGMLPVEFKRGINVKTALVQVGMASGRHLQMVKNRNYSV